MAKTKMTARMREVPILQCTECLQDLTSCWWCGFTFNKDNEFITCIKERNRHAHKACIPDEDAWQTQTLK